MKNPLNKIPGAYYWRRKALCVGVSEITRNPRFQAWCKRHRALIKKEICK